ncbi:MAG: hypothetical protein HY774_08690 [Acidobacteria bacterium]|nr:hypothetical protein [Acidobacteriota bacterium]
MSYLMSLMSPTWTAFLRLFAATTEDYWQEIATKWLITTLVVAAVCSGVMLAVKWVLKRNAGAVNTWSRGRTLLFIVIGFIPVLLGAVLIFLTNTQQFQTEIGTHSLCVGIFFSWVNYVVFMVFGHLGPWRGDLV